jgi:hypothetical protein
MTSKVYSIYIDGKCVLKDLTKKKFNENWETLNNLVGLLKTDYTAEDLSYTVNPSE